MGFSLYSVKSISVNHLRTTVLFCTLPHCVVKQLLFGSNGAISFEHQIQYILPLLENVYWKREGLKLNIIKMHNWIRAKECNPNV